MKPGRANNTTSLDVDEGLRYFSGDWSRVLVVLAIVVLAHRFSSVMSRSRQSQSAESVVGLAG